ncbi:MAG TPA: hypothetical protein VGX02_10920 [Candidatus Eremiobacteraceae bacterium]|nr:hypothetical protein [Candidatus Eremiobacteraceae bacterium]
MRHLRFVSVCAVICIALTLGSSRTATPKSDYNELLNGAKIVWDSVLIQSDSPCWPDARDAVDYALDHYDSMDKSTEENEGYDTWHSGLPFMGKKVADVLKQGAFDKGKVTTLSYDVSLEGGDEELYVDLIDKVESTSAGVGKTTTLYHVFGVVHGSSLCGAKEGTPEDVPFFASFSVWFDGYYQATKATKTADKPYPREEASSPAASWAKDLKKQLPNEGGIDRIGCCKLPEKKTVTGTTQTEPPKTTQIPTPTPAPKPGTGTVEKPSGGTNSKPTPTPTPTPAAAPKKPPTPAPLDKDPKRTSLTPQPGQGTGTDQNAYLPPIAGPNSFVVGWVSDPNTSGPTSYIVGTVEPNGKKNFWSGLTDENGHVRFKLPAIALTAVTLFRFFDAHGNPDEGARCTIGTPPHLEGTDPIPNVPVAQQPAIVEGSSAYQHGVFYLHTRGTDALNTRVLLDGGENGIRTVGTSDESTAALIDDNVSLGEHWISVESDGKLSTKFPADVLSVTGEPLPNSVPGQVSTVRVHVDGVPAGHTAHMAFQIGGVATLLDGSSETTVPVVNGLAEVQIRGVHSGKALVRFRLLVAIPGFWQAQ